MANKKKQAGKATKEYKKVRSSVPRVSYTQPSNMYTGPTTQRGITFAQGGPVDPNMMEDFYENEETPGGPNDPNAKRKLNTKGEVRKVPAAPKNPKTGKPITGRESYANAEALYNPIRTRLEKAFGSREAALKAIDPALKEKLYYTSTKDNPYYQFFDPNILTDPTADQSYQYDKQGNIVMRQSSEDETKELGVTKTALENRRYVPPLDDTLKEMQSKFNSLSDAEIRKLASQKFTDKEGNFIGISNVTMPSNVNWRDKAGYGIYFGGKDFARWTFANGGPTNPIVTRATTLPDGSIIPMMDLPEINITAESPKTQMSNLMGNPYMQQRQMELQKQGVINSQNKGTLGNTNDRPWYSGAANMYEQAKRNQAVQAAGVGALGAGAIMGGVAAAPYMTGTLLPATNAAMTTPIAGVAGATPANFLGAYGLAGGVTHGVKAGQKVYEGAPASEVGKEVVLGLGEVMTPGYKAIGPAAKLGWKAVGTPTVDTFYTAGENTIDSLASYGLGAHVVHGGPRWIDKYESGDMIKRADGSYSPRGLWDNIRANRGSGNEPTEEMLKQERIIRATEKNEFGGTTGMYDVYGDGDKVNLNLPSREMPAPPRGLEFNNYLRVMPSMGGDGTPALVGGVNPMYHGNNFSVGPYATGYADLQGMGMTDYGIRGKYNVNDRFSIGADMNRNRINAGLQYKFAKGGSITPTPTGDIFDMMGMSYLNNFALGAEIPCDTPPCPQSDPRLVSSIPEGYMQDPNNPRLYMKSTSSSTPGMQMNANMPGSATTPFKPRTSTPKPITNTRVTPKPKVVRPSTASSTMPPTMAKQEDYVYMNEVMAPMQPKPASLITQPAMDIQPMTGSTPQMSMNKGLDTRGSGSSSSGPSDLQMWYRNNIRRPVRKVCNKVQDSTGRFVDKCFEFEDGGTVPFDVKAPMYDETEFNPYINPDVYAYGSGIHIKPENRGKFTAWASSRGMSVPEAASRVMSNTDQYSPGVVRMANFAKNAAGWNKNEMGGYYGMGGYYKMGGYPSYAMGGNVPAYAFGDVVKDIGAGAYGVLEGTLDTVTMGATDQLTDMGYKGLQGLGGSEGKELRTQNMLRGFGTAAGAGIGATVNPAATGSAISQGAKGLGQGISLAAPESKTAQALGQFLPVAGNLASMFAGSPAAGSAGAAKSAEFASTGFGKMAGQAGQAGQMFNQLSPLFAMFGGQNAMENTMKNGGMTPGYTNNMPIFAQGGMTMGNVEARELLIDPEQYGGGGVPKVLTNYSSPNLPSHPEDGAIDDRGTVPLPEGKFIITQAENNRYKTATRSNDKLMANAITNNIQIKRAKKEAEEMQKASTAYNRFMSKYGGAIEKMYACGGKTYGCGGSVKKYQGGADILPFLNTPPLEMGSSLPQGWNLGTGTLPSSNTGDFNMLKGTGSILDEPRLTTAPIGSSLPQGWNLSKTPATVDASAIFQDYRNSITNQPSSSDTKVPGVGGGPGKNRSTQVLGALQMAAPLYNLGRGLFSKVTQVPKGLGMVSTDIKAPKMTDAAGKRAIREQMNLAKYNMGQLGGANVLPAMTALGTAGMKATSDYTEKLNNTIAQNIYNAEMDKKTLERANAAQSAQNWQTQEYLKGLKDQMLSAGIGQLGEAAGQLRKENAYGNAMKDFYTNYTYDPATQTWSPRVK